MSHEFKGFYCIFDRSGEPFTWSLDPTPAGAVERFIRNMAGAEAIPNTLLLRREWFREAQDKAGYSMKKVRLTITEEEE